MLAGIDADAWLTPTPAWGWDVRDTIAHLADTDEMAIDTATGGPYAINDLAARAASGADVTYHGVLRGRRLAGRRGRRRGGSARRPPSGRCCAASPPDARVPWGIGMRTPSFVTARLMETWAHGLDVRAALGRAGRRHRPARARRLARDPGAPLRLLGRRPRAARTRRCGSS